MTISASTPKRVVVLLTSIALALVLLLAGAVVARAADDPGISVVSVHEVQHTVQPGDNLWGIAAQYTTPGEDVRAVIHEIRIRNGLTDSVIHAGQILRIPIDF